MPVERREWVTKEMMRSEPKTLFVFGDNLARWGRGGQAAEMRDEPNAIGLPTKRSPYQFLYDRDLETVKQAIEPEVLALETQLRHGWVVVWPTAGIGTGLASLDRHAPTIREFYDDLLERLVTIRPEVDSADSKA